MNEEYESPLKAIRAKCIDCCCGNTTEVKLCPAEDCPIWNYRFGKNPFNKRTLSEEQRLKKAEILQTARERKRVKEGYDKELMK